MPAMNPKDWRDHLGIFADVSLVRLLWEYIKICPFKIEVIYDALVRNYNGRQANRPNGADRSQSVVFKTLSCRLAENYFVLKNYHLI